MTTRDYHVEQLDDERILENFLTCFRDLDKSNTDQCKYVLRLRSIIAGTARTIVIELDDLRIFSKNEALLLRVTDNASRYLSIIHKITERLIVELERESGSTSSDHLMRWHETRLLPPSTVQTLPLRRLKAANIGHLVKLRGIVIRVSDVKPLAKVLAYTCESCGHKLYYDLSRKTEFLPPSTCESEYCTNNNTVGLLYHHSRASKFVKYQELRIQELPSQVPVGNVPRSITVQCRGELTRHCTPGDTVFVCGIFLPQSPGGNKGATTGLESDTFLDATHITKEKQSFWELDKDSNAENRIDMLANSQNAYSRLSQSIAPEIFGHEDVKKALLLQLVEGHSEP